MMTERKEQPYLKYCGICGDGLVRFWYCKDLKDMAAMCDECESIWQDIEKIASEPFLSPIGSFPEWPGPPGLNWELATLEQIQELGFDKYIAGESV